MSKTRAFNEKIEESVGQISESSEHVGAEVRRAVTSLQFQDMATQVLGTMQGRVENLASLLESLAVLSLEHRESGDDLRDDCEKRLDEFKTALNEAEQLLERAGHNPVSQKSLDEGDIELF
jgi:methyl-accepting chemotaxis protein